MAAAAHQMMDHDRGTRERGFVTHNAMCIELGIPLAAPARAGSANGCVVTMEIRIFGFIARPWVKQWMRPFSS